MSHASDEWGNPIIPKYVQECYGVLSTWTPRDASVSAHVIAACRGHAAEISFAGDVGLLSYELIGPVNPFACEVRFHMVFKTKAAYEAYKTHASVSKFEKLLEAQGADKPTLEFFQKVEQGQKYAANSRNMGLPLDVSKGIGIIATFNCKTPEIIQAAMKVAATHFERQFSTEPYSTGYSILFDESKPNTFVLYELWESATDYWEVHARNGIMPLLRDQFYDVGVRITEGECAIVCYSLWEHGQAQKMPAPPKYVATGKTLWDFSLPNSMWRE